MPDTQVDIDSLIGGWRGALQAAQAALLSAGRDHDLSGADLQARSRRLTDERAALVGVLGEFAHDRYARPRLVRLLGSAVESRKLLGVPAAVEGCIFNVDGVLVASTALHLDAWRELFNQFVAREIERTGVAHAAFSRRSDYPGLIYGRSREEAVRAFLQSRGIGLPEGEADDPPERDTVHGLANRKNALLYRRLEEHGIRAFDGARLYLRLLRDAGLRCAVVSGSTNTQALLERADLVALIDEVIDGNTARAEGLRRKPAPDMLLAACARLGLTPERVAAFEVPGDGLDAARAGGFGYVVLVEEGGRPARLEAAGADRVVADLGEILEHGLGAPAAPGRPVR